MNCYTFITIIIFIIVGLLLIIKKKYNINHFNIKNNTINKNQIFNVDENYDYRKNNSNFKRENETIYEYNKLIDLLNNINKSDIVHLKDKTEHNFYTQSTTQRVLRDDLRNISKIVVDTINKNGYQFHITNFGDVDLWIDKNNNEEINYELFVWDSIRYTQFKFIIHVVKFVDKYNIKPFDLLNDDFTFKYLPIGLPSYDQMIPGAMDVVPTGNMILSNKSINKKDAIPIKYLHINRIYIQNSTLVINYDKDIKYNNIISLSSNNGIDDNSIEFVDTKTNNNPIQPPAKIADQWIRLDEEPNFKAQYPAKPPCMYWGTDGVYKDLSNKIMKKIDAKFSSTPGTYWSTHREPLQPQFWLNNYARDGNNCGPYAWLYDNASDVNGTFIGGGKM